MGQDNQIAVYIDYDNIEMSVEESLGKNADVDWTKVFQTASQVGRVILRRAYADWAEAASHQRQLLSLGVELIHVNSRRGKNAADIRIVIDALELLHDHPNSFSHVMLVSGDGDFTELVHRLRAHGKNVIGMGVNGTSAEYLVNACDKFIFYDKLPGVNKVKKSNQNQNQPAALKQNNGVGNRPLPVLATPEAKLEQYLNLLSTHKIRMAPTPHRPIIIYKIYEIVKSNPGFTFNQLKDFAEAHFASATPKIDAQLVLDTAHQLFHTFCFEFDADTSERIWNRKMWLPEDIQSAAALMDKCDRKILQMLVAAFGSVDKIDKEVAARLLYGGLRTAKVLDHIAGLLTAE